MKFRILYFTLAIIVSAVSAYATKTDTLSVPSKANNLEIGVTVIRPDKYVQNKKYPVLYLLNGHGGNQFSWPGNKKDLSMKAEELGIIVVCPDGRNSWYWDSPIDSTMQMETFVSSELVDYIDAHYPTLADKSARAVTGYSMGGHGALWLGINHPDVFGACGSMSGGVDIRPFPEKWNMKDRLGDFADNTELWNGKTVINIIDRIRPGQTIIFDCGSSDFFFDVNNRLHEEMIYRNIPHDYISRPGAHNWDYWTNALDYQLLFFDKFFTDSISK